MKKVVFILVLVFLSVNALAQKVIQMENTNGVYRIACSVNGAKMKMIFDTGASTVSLSETMANFLYDNGYISDEDVLGTSKSRTADGAIHDNVVINLKDIEISGLHLKNVLATVISSQNAPLLLGQTAIQKLGRISLNGNKLFIHDYKDDYTDEELDEIEEQAFNDYKNKNYHASLDGWKTYLDYRELTTYGYYILINCLMQTKQYEEVIKYGKEWEVKCRDEEPNQYSIMILSAMGSSFSMQDNTKESITYLEKCASLELKLGNNPCITYAQIALYYQENEDYNSAITYSKKALKGMFELFETSENEIRTKGIDNESLGACLYTYATALYGKDDVSSGNYIMGLSANCNYEPAIDYCFKHNIRYKSRQSLFE